MAEYSAYDAGNFETLDKMQLSIIKPLTPDWIYTAYTYIKERPQLVLNGWDASGLLAPFKEETKAAALRTAKLANIDPTHPYFPLFPSSVNTEEGEPDPTDCDAAEDDAEGGELERQVTVDLGLAALQAGRAEAEADAPRPKRRGITMSSGQQMYPMFSAPKRSRAE